MGVLNEKMCKNKLKQNNLKTNKIEIVFDLFFLFIKINNNQVNYK